jgi:hypothetical protein
MPDLRNGRVTCGGVMGVGDSSRPVRWLQLRRELFTPASATLSLGIECTFYMNV